MFYLVAGSGYLIFVRWRKPRWVPMAKSKLEIVPQRRPVVPWEEEFSKKHYPEYRTAIKALRCYFKQEQIALSETGAIMLEKAKREEEEFQQLLAENAEENERVAKIREASVQAEQDARILRRLKGMEFLKQKRAVQAAKADEAVVILSERAKKFITPETLDHAIEECLNSLSNYDFAIDKNGNVYEGQDISVGNADSEPAAASAS